MRFLVHLASGGLLPVLMILVCIIGCGNPDYTNDDFNCVNTANTNQQLINCATEPQLLPAESLRKISEEEQDVTTASRLVTGRKSFSFGYEVDNLRNNFGRGGQTRATLKCYVGNYRERNNSDTFYPWLTKDGTSLSTSLLSTHWAGALIQGNSIEQGELKPIIVKRNPVTISISNIFLKPGASYSRTIENPTYEKYDAAIRDMLSAGVVGTGSKLSYEMRRVRNLNELKFCFSITISIDLWIASCSVGVDNIATYWNDKNHIMVKFNQTFFTVAVNTPETPASVFHPQTTPDELRPYVQPGNPPGYISNINYGRSLIVIFSSVEDVVELEIRARAAFSLFGIKIKKSKSKSISAHSFDVEDLLIICPDGKAQELFAQYDLEDEGDTKAAEKKLMEIINDYFLSQPNPTAEDYGAPISYQERWVKNNQPAKISLTNEFQHVECFTEPSL